MIAVPFRARPRVTGIVLGSILIAMAPVIGFLVFLGGAYQAVFGAVPEHVEMSNGVTTLMTLDPYEEYVIWSSDHEADAGALTCEIRGSDGSTTVLYRVPDMMLWPSLAEDTFVSLRGFDSGSAGEYSVTCSVAESTGVLAVSAPTDTARMLSVFTWQTRGIWVGIVMAAGGVSWLVVTIVRRVRWRTGFRRAVDQARAAAWGGR